MANPKLRAAFILWSSVTARLALNAYAGSNCHTGFSQIGDHLWSMPMYWAVPIGCIPWATRAKTGILVCRAATWASIVGWLTCLLVGY